MLLRDNFVEYDNESEISNLFSKWTKDINSSRDIQVLKLYVQRGTPALYVEDIDGSGMGRREFEMILPQDATIKKLRSPYWDNKYGFWIHECALEYGALH